MGPKYLYVPVILCLHLFLVYGKHSLNETENLVEEDDNLVNFISYNDSLNNLDLYPSDDRGDDYSNTSKLLTHGTKDTFNYTAPAVDRNATNFTASVADNSTVVDNNGTVAKCPMCVLREGEKNFRIEMIKNKIMTKLNFQLENMPNMTGRVLPKIPRLTSLLHKSQIQNDGPNYEGDRYIYEDDPYGHTERMFNIAQEPPPNLPVNKTITTYFQLPEAAKNSVVKKATLWYYMKPIQQQKTIIKVNIHKLKPIGIGHSKHELYSLKYWKAPPRKARYWHQLDIKDTVQQWLDKPHLNYGLQLIALDHNDENLIVTPSTATDWEGYEPMIELKTIKRNRRRVRRSNHYAMRCSANSTETRCCRYPLRVNFVDFGWDWVIAPRDYMANYCSGECRYSQQDDSHHSYVQQQASNADPCCTPSEYSTLSMLYFDHDHTILFMHLQQMSVEQCGCS